MPKILAIDDKMDNLVTLSALLKNLMPGCAVITAQSGLEGIAKAKAELPDAILLDVKMPDMDGFETCKRLMDDDSTKSIPVIMITAIKTDPQSRIEGLDCGANAFLSKPIDEVELVSQVKVALRIKEAEDALREEKYSLEKKVQERTAALSASEEQYRTILQTAMDGFWLVDTQGRLLKVNDAYFRMSGYSTQELLDMRVSDLEAIEKADDIAFHIQKVIAQGEDRFESRHHRKDGSIFNVEVSVQYLPTDGGQLVAFLRDITERKQAEEQKREQGRLNQILIDSLPCISLLMRPKTREIVAMNKAAKEAGCSIGHACFETWPKFEQPCPWCLAPKLWTEGQAQQCEVEGLGVIWDAHWEPVREDLYLHYAFDITDRKQVEETLQRTLESLRKSMSTTIQVLVSAVEARDPYTAGHQLKSANLARAIATEMGLSQEKIEGIRMAGSIHDLGKISIPAELLSKPTKLSEIEFSLIKAHSQRGFEMLKDVESPWPLAEIVYQHHERMDGSGYPRNLKGDDILIEARILAVADTVEAMASHRPYRPGLGIDAALNEIEKNRGIFYDEAVADACLRLIREKGFKLEGIWL